MTAITPTAEGRSDIIETLQLPSGLEVYLMHNNALAVPYYLATNGSRCTAQPVKEGEISRLRELCAAAYQFAGVHNASVSWLDALSNAASGLPFSDEDLIPCEPNIYTTNHDPSCGCHLCEFNRIRQQLADAQRHLVNGEKLYIAVRDRCARTELMLAEAQAEIAALRNANSDMAARWKLTKAELSLANAACDESSKELAALKSVCWHCGGKHAEGSCIDAKHPSQGEEGKP